ncbi:MAG: conserved putative rane protein [Chlamydiales bacterium]|nr:conserved putative rane protein [Chlamydiales bacterium]
MLIVLFALLSNLFVLKQIHLFFWDVTESEVYAVATFLGLSLLQEFYGRESARRAALLSLFALLTYCGFALLHLCYIPNDFDCVSPHFAAILTPTPRILLSSLFCYFISAKMDLFSMRALKRRFPNAPLELRTSCSLLLSQAVDTSLFTFLALYGMIANPWHVIIVSLLIKACAILLAAPVINLTKKFLLPS